MRADAEHLGDAFQGTGGIEYDGSVHRVVHPLGDVGHQQRGDIDADQVGDIQSRGGQFGTELPRPVAIAEPRTLGQPRQLSGSLGPRDFLAKRRDARIEARVEFSQDPRRPPGHGGREDRAPGPHDPVRLGESTQPVGPLTQVI
jgi:hypothetical protein